MKKVIKILIIAAAAFFAAENSADAQLLKNLLNKTTNSNTTENISAGTSKGQAAGAALKALYIQYKADGKKLDMSNLNNMINLATLAGCVENLKGMNNKSTFYMDFAKGLITGSGNLVNNKNSTSVMNGITNLVNNVDISGLTNKTSTVTENANEIANSVSSILNLFK